MQMSLCGEVDTSAVSQTGRPPCPGRVELGQMHHQSVTAPAGRQGAHAWHVDTQLLFSDNVIPSNS